MEYATFTPVTVKDPFHFYHPGELYCEHCGQCWSQYYDDYAGMQDMDFIVCTCGDPICQVGELKNA